MKKPYLFLLLFPLFCLAEPSAFEKQSGATKNDLKALQSVVTKLQQKVETIQQAQEGISSLHESQSSKIQQQLIQATQNAKDIEELKTQTELYKKLQQQVETNTQDIALLKTQIQELNTSLKTLNQTILDELKNSILPHKISRMPQMQILPNQLLLQKTRQKRRKSLLKHKIYSQRKNTILQKLGLNGCSLSITRKQRIIFIWARLLLLIKPTMMPFTTTNKVHWQMIRQNICPHFYSILLNLSTLSKIQKTIISFWIP